MHLVKTITLYTCFVTALKIIEHADIGKKILIYIFTKVRPQFRLLCFKSHACKRLLTCIWKRTQFMDRSLKIRLFQILFPGNPLLTFLRGMKTCFQMAYRYSLFPLTQIWASSPEFTHSNNIVRFDVESLWNSS